MRPINSNAIVYAPGIISTAKPENLNFLIQNELMMIGAAIMQLAEGHIDMCYVAPEKPREGDIRLADGTYWNPGGGKGFYVYYDGGWNRLLTTNYNFCRAPTYTTAPSSPVVGDIVYADGTDWDPGSGAGIYAYYGSAWNKLG